MNFVQPIRDTKKIEAMRKILQAGNFGARNDLFFVLGINTGLRISDILDLRVGELVDTKRRVRDFVVLQEKKTGKTRRFPVPPVIVKTVKTYLDTGEYPSNEFLFKSRKGDKAITRNQAWAILNEAAESVGIRDNIGTHTLRKTFGYHAYKRGVSLELIMDLLNHSSQKDTLGYIGITQDDKDEVIMSLNLGG